MKKFLAVCLIVCFIMTFIGCDSNVRDEIGSSDINASSEVVSDVIVGSDEEIICENVVVEDVKITEEDIRRLVDANYYCITNIYAYAQLEFKYDEATWEHGAATPVVDDRFATYEDLETYIRDIYVEEEADYLLYEYYDGEPLYFEEDGIFYTKMLINGGGMLCGWEGYTIETINVNGNTCEFVILAHYPTEVHYLEKYTFYATYEDKWLLNKLIFQPSYCGRKIVGEEYVYSIEENREEESKKILGWEIQIYDDNSLTQKIELNKESVISQVPDLDEIIWEADVNFDGKKDLLIFKGYYDSEESKRYECYIADECGFKYCSGFSMIQNPEIDEANKLIIGEFYHHQNSYSKRFYRYNEGTFEMVQEDLYKYEEETKEYVFEYTFDSTIPLFTSTDTAISGKYTGLNGDSYSINIYTGVSVEDSGNEIGNLCVNDGYDCLYKIDENYFTANGYYLRSSLEENVWIIRMYDNSNVLVDELTMVQHYES